MGASDPRLSPQQSRPLAVEGASVALSAGAGCGKTTVLTARFLGDLDGPAAKPLNTIVALTFTEKAARELRQRIRTECRRRLAASEDPAHWRAVLRGLEAAPIGTFHEYCGQWLRRHAVEAGVDPDFVIFDASIAGAIRDEALGKCLRQWLAFQDPDLVELAVELGLGRVRQGLAHLLQDAAADQLLSWRDRSAAEVESHWREIWRRDGLPRLASVLVQAGRTCLELLSRHESTHPVMKERRAFLLERLPEIDVHCADPDWRRELREHAMVRGAGSKVHWSSPEVYEAVGSRLKELRDAIDAYGKKSAWDESATREAAEQGLRMARLAAQARQAYDAAKRARGGLDFDDLLSLTLQQLRGRSDPARLGLALASDDSIARLLVDEFQDTDPTQSEILERLTAPGALSGRLFLVGDFKQSIYRFRGAQPEIFQQFRDRFPTEGRHDLTENYRSVPEILRFVNALFAATFPEAGSALSPRTPGSDQAGQPAVEFHWLPESDSDPEPEPESDPHGESERSRATTRPNPSIHQQRVREARGLAHRIRQRLNRGWQVRDRATNQLRDAQPGDVAFLFRAMTDVGPYETALAEAGFDYHTIGGAAFYLQQEVTDLVNVLSCVEDPFDEVALAGALRSPFFGVSDNGLFWLGTAPGGLTEGLENLHAIDELSDVDRQQATRSHQLLRRWRGFKDHEPIAALVHRILDESGYEAALLGESLGPRKRANARKLVRLARRFDQQRGLTLAAFVAKLRADLRRPPREEQAATDEAGTSVRLMSIHQAKGLEFPIVVLPDLNRKPPGRVEATAFHRRLGPLIRPSREPGAPLGDDDAAASNPRQSLGWLTYQTLERHEEEQESLRLFYVATTRARDALILSAAVTGDDRPASPALSLLDSRFDRRTGRRRVELPEGWDEPNVLVTTAPLFASAGSMRRGADRLPLLEAAAAIEQAPLSDEPPSARIQPRPRYVELDSTFESASATARIDRLTRIVMADPEFTWGRVPTKLAARLVKQHDPLLPTRARAALLARLEAWTKGPLARRLVGSSVVATDLEWTIAWPSDQPDATVFHGRLDLLYRDREGLGQVVNLGAGRESDVQDRVRLLLAVQAAEASGWGQVRAAWRPASPNPNDADAPQWSCELRLDVAAVDQAVRTYFGSRTGTADRP